VSVYQRGFQSQSLLAKTIGFVSCKRCLSNDDATFFVLKNGTGWIADLFQPLPISVAFFFPSFTARPFFPE